MDRWRSPVAGLSRVSAAGAWGLGWVTIVAASSVAVGCAWIARLDDGELAPADGGATTPTGGGGSGTGGSSSLGGADSGGGGSLQSSSSSHGGASSQGGSSSQSN